MSVFCMLHIIYWKLQQFNFSLVYCGKYVGQIQPNSQCEEHDIINLQVKSAWENRRTSQFQALQWKWEGSVGGWLC